MSQEESQPLSASNDFFNDPPSPYLTPFREPLTPTYNFFKYEDNYEIFDVPNVLENEPYEPEHSAMMNQKSEQIEKETKEQGLLELNLPLNFEKQYFSEVKQKLITRREIVKLLTEKDSRSERELRLLGKQLYQNSDVLSMIFEALLSKFKKLKKTKEEMVKYCIRKAFKFVSDSKDEDVEDEESCNIILYNGINGYRKTTSEKTINAFFLKQLFSQAEFTLKYSQFLKEFRALINDDNERKMNSLSKTILKLVSNNKIDQLSKIRRMPWTKSILDRTEEVANELIEFSSTGTSKIKKNRHR